MYLLELTYVALITASLIMIPNPRFRGRHAHRMVPRYDFSSEHVREYLLLNIEYWIEELGIDGMRFDLTICIR